MSGRMGGRRESPNLYGSPEGAEPQILLVIRLTLMVCSIRSSISQPFSMKPDLCRELLLSSLVALAVCLLMATWQPASLIRIQTAPEPRSTTIHVGLILKRLEQGGRNVDKLKKQLVVLLRSILVRFSWQHRLHLCFTANRNSIPYIVRLVDKFANKSMVPDLSLLSYDFVELSAFSEHFGTSMMELRPLFTSQSARKYIDDLYLIAPFYCRVFPFGKLIMLDVDLKFNIDLTELYHHFEQFDDEQLIGLSPDLAPHYRIAFRHYRDSHPDTEVGEPGPLQGFNTGVALFHLDRLRMSGKFRKYADNQDKCTSNLADKYVFRSHLGDQCFFTLLGMEHRSWFYHLPCGYNFQLDTSMLQRHTESYFDAYHNCTQKPKIYHGNGGTDIPDTDDMSQE